MRWEGRAGNLNKVPSDLYVISTDSSVRTGPRSSLTSGLRKAKMRSRKTGTQAVRQTTDVSHPCGLSATSCQHLCRASRKNRRGSLGAPSGLSGVTHARGLAVRNLRKGETAATVFCHVSLTSPGVEPAPNQHGPLQSRQPRSVTAAAPELGVRCGPFQRPCLGPPLRWIIMLPARLKSGGRGERPQLVS